MSSRAGVLVVLVTLAACGKPATAPAPVHPTAPEPKPVTKPSALADAKRVVATVNGVAIPWAPFAERMDAIVQRRARSGGLTNEQARELGTRVMIELAWQEMLRQECERLGLDYDPAEIPKVEEALFGSPTAKGYGKRRGGPDDTHTDASRRAAAIAELRSRLVIDALARESVTPERVAKEYEASKAEFTSARGWARIAEVVFRFPGPGPSGVLACDDLLHRYERCLAAHPDDPALPTLVMRMRSDFEEHATKGTPAAAELLARECRDRSSRLAESRMMGCDWTAQAPGGAKLRREQRSVLLTNADALVRAAKADPKAFDDAARAPEGTKLPPLYDVVSLSELDPKLARALEKLPLGEISQPVAASDGVHVIRVLERWPAGALPFEVRGPAIERELYEEHAALLGMQLRERLDLRYEIRTELDVSDWAKGPGATQEELDAKP